MIFIKIEINDFFISIYNNIKINTNDMKSQKQLILEHLLKGKGITQRECIAFFNCIRLSAIIYDLKKDGYKFITIHKPNVMNNGKYAKYFLIKNDTIDYDF